jgi:hypothetical protein
MPSETDVRILIDATDKTAEGLEGAKEGLRGLEDEESAATQTAIEHGKAIQDNVKDYKLANIESMLTAQALNQVGSSMKGYTAALAGNDKSMDKWQGGIKSATTALREQHPVLTSSIVTMGSFVSSLASGVSTYMQLSEAIGKALAAHGIDIVATVKKTVANGAHAASQWLVNASMYGCPLVWIIAAIIALIVVVVLLVKYWDQITEAFGKFGDWAKKGLGDASKAAGDWAANTGAAMGNAGASLTKWQDGNAKALKDFVGGIGDSIKGAWDKVTGWLKNLWSEISGAFNKIISGALDWGKDLLKKFIEGMLEGIRKIPLVGDLIADKLEEWLGFSGPPPEGALHRVPEWGGHLVESYAKGMRSAMPAIESSLNLTIDSQLRSLSRAQAAASTSYSTSYNNNRNASQQNNIYISNADPNAIAARVLQLLEEALR